MHRKTLIPSPCVMYKDDLYALESILREHLPSKGYNFQIRGIEHGHDISAKPCLSLDELLSQENHPDYLDQITIDIKEVSGEDRLIHSIQVHIDKRVSDVQLYSDHDEEWMKEVYRDLKIFFEKRRPWYWFLGLSVPPVFNLSLGFALTMSAFIIVAKANLALIFPLILLLSGGIYMGLGITRKIFRHARICLFQMEEDRRPNYELVAIVAHMVVVAVSITGTVIMTSGKI